MGRHFQGTWTGEQSLSGISNTVEAQKGNVVKASCDACFAKIGDFNMARRGKPTIKKAEEEHTPGSKITSTDSEAGAGAVHRITSDDPTLMRRGVISRERVHRDHVPPNHTLLNKPNTRTIRSTASVAATNRPSDAKVFSIDFDNTAEERAVRDALRDFDRQQERIEAMLERYQLGRRRERFIRRITIQPGLRGFLPLSYLPARKASSSALIAALTAFAAERRSTRPKFSVYMGTFGWEDGISLQQRPRIHLKRIKGKVDKALRELGLNGVYHVELEYLLAWDGTKGTHVNAHVHVACWTSSGRFRPRMFAKRMMKTARFPNPLDAPSVDFRRRTAQTSADIAGLARYISKWQLCVKQRRQNADGSYRLDKYDSKYGYAKTIRMVEILSRINLYDSVGGVGEGKIVRKAWKQAITQWERNQSQPYLRIDPDQISRGWKAVATRVSKLKRMTKVR